MAIVTGKLPVVMPINGVRVAAVSAGIRKPGRKDLVLFELSESCNVSATFTRNVFCAAPVVLARQHLQKGKPRYLLINAGNANAGTGEQGYIDTVECCRIVAESTGCNVADVLPFSTGVIGEQLPVDRIREAVPELLSGLDADNWEDAASAILTTDTVTKVASKKIRLSGGDVTISGVAKGSGMIRPDMATMLAFVATDAELAQELLDNVLLASVKKSFNRITVDGDTSTNDACVLVSSGASGVSVDASAAEFQLFSSALDQIMIELAQQIVRDGEGATKFVTINVAGGNDEEECSKVAYTIAHSPLVKTALFASDPNWGRILAAIGRSGIEDLDIGKVNIYIGNVCIVNSGEPDPDYTEKRGVQVMSGSEIDIHVDLGRGEMQATVWTCDFSYDYVKINAEYRT